MVVAGWRAGSAIFLVVPDIRPGSLVAVQVLLGNGGQPLVEGLSGKTGASRAIYRPSSRLRSAWV